MLSLFIYQDTHKQTVMFYDVVFYFIFMNVQKNLISAVCLLHNAMSLVDDLKLFRQYLILLP